MTEAEFWQRKLQQYFHDSPDKLFFLKTKGGHGKVAAEHFAAFLGLKEGAKPPKKLNDTAADVAATGADRPMLTIYTWKQKGAKPFDLHWPSSPILTHPLDNAPIDFGSQKIQSKNQAAKERKATREALWKDADEAAKCIASPTPEWDQSISAKTAFFQVWRNYRDKIVSRSDSDNRNNIVAQSDRDKIHASMWRHMPADSRDPDHTIWDHLKVTSALSFMKRKDSSEARTPWMLRFAIGPVGEYLEEARSSRDLWVGSFLISDLAWHAMKPFVEKYGPDAIVYPDLNGNPRADFGLQEIIPETLPEGAQTASFASLLPNAFVVLVPRGDQESEHLERLEKLAEKSREQVEARWQALANLVENWLLSVKGEGNWQQIWKRQLKTMPLHTTWVAVPWLPLDQTREERLKPWLADEVWNQYEKNREVFDQTNSTLLHSERGFDYALTHHQLRMRHQLRNQSPPYTLGEAEPGEKCTLCGKREALRNETEGTMDGQRALTRKFWTHPLLDPDQSGSERLCGVCSVKRFIVEAGVTHENKLIGLNPLWAGSKVTLGDLGESSKPRVPFPPAPAVAAQVYMEKIVGEPNLEILLAGVCQAYLDTRLPLTTFPRALPRLAMALENATDNGRHYLKMDTQLVVFPDALRGLRDSLARRKVDEETRKNQPSLTSLDKLEQAVRKLQNAAAKQNIRPPATRFAVIRMDGDSMGKLLLGEEGKIGACWQDIIHPEAVKKVHGHPQMEKAGWKELLGEQRLMGPSLHAFISRALAEFANRIVPWVVEREFSGRLIYAGGDDLLCLAPVADALPLTARLQQLFSAPWVIDTDPDIELWEWRKQGSKEPHDPKKNRQRFQIPKMPQNCSDEENIPAIRLPVTEVDLLEEHVVGRESVLNPDMPVDGLLIPMLGRHQSLSAGIAIGHYKTPLSTLLVQSKSLLNDLAKDKSGRKSIALGHNSRNGVKTEFALKWHREGEERPNAHHIMGDVSKGFGDGQIPNRLPYKLRGYSSQIDALFQRVRDENRGEMPKVGEKEWQNHCRPLLLGLLKLALDGKKPQALDQILTLWERGLALHDEKVDKGVDGLLLCRLLSREREET
ncbi:MAG: type III-B CRISPR-associated protein Cas10/Cmr2 [Magnetococcales bacterium]|nr:type III-B CRISPR-associated protein Cas10/Cmr2 [Magnetococcales bacterium]